MCPFENLYFEKVKKKKKKKKKSSFIKLYIEAKKQNMAYNLFPNTHIMCLQTRFAISSRHKIYLLKNANIFLIK